MGRGLSLRLPEPGAPLTLAAVRVAAGLVFLAFGIGKFTSHASELASFKSYGLPAPEVFAYAIGVLEIVGGALLVLGLFTRLVALALAGDMVGAIVVSGLAKGEIISLTLAPALLVAMGVLVARGPGAPSLREES
jgi:putative oxidoreductase